MNDKTMVCADDECRVLVFQYANEPGITYRDGSCPACGGSGSQIKQPL